MDETSVFPVGSLGDNLLLDDFSFSLRKRFGYDHVFYFWDLPKMPVAGLEEGYWFVDNRPYRYCLRVSGAQVLKHQKVFYRAGTDVFYSVIITRSFVRRVFSWWFLTQWARAKIELFLLVFSLLAGAALIVYPFLDTIGF